MEYGGKGVHGTSLKFKPTLYISGPMQGIQDLNFPAFQRASDNLTNAGFKVVSPHTLGDAGSWEENLKRDIIIMLGECQGLAMLPGHLQSPGATLEKHIAEKVGMPIMAYMYWVEIKNHWK